MVSDIIAFPERVPELLQAWCGPKLCRRFVVQMKFKGEPDWAAMAEARADHSLESFAGTLEPWTRDGALEMEIRQQDAECLSFDVTRCRYAEMYRALGIPELGALLSCNRDAALIEGYHPGVQLTRSTTLMQGGSCCDFRYELIQGSPSTNVPGVKS